MFDVFFANIEYFMKGALITIQFSIGGICPVCYSRYPS